LRFGGQQRVQLLRPMAAALGFGYIILSEETVDGGKCHKKAKFFCSQWDSPKGLIYLIKNTLGPPFLYSETIW